MTKPIYTEKIKKRIKAAIERAANKAEAADKKADHKSTLITFNTTDIIDNFDCTEQEAENFLHKYHKQIQETLCRAGWDAIQTFGIIENLGTAKQDLHYPKHERSD